LDDGDQLLRRCQQGDPAALGELVRRYQEPIFRLAYRVAGDAALAEEATANALQKVWAKAGQWRGEARAGTWIYRVAVRAILDTQRGQRRWWRRWARRLPPALVDPQPGPPEQALAREQQENTASRVHEALRQLAEADRVLIHLYYFENRGLAEIASILGVARERLKMRLARARQRLRTYLEGHDAS
jgi:RNA polymerase sigma-70 factor (ECF subfamily)